MFHDAYLMIDKTGLSEEIRDRDFRLQIGINKVKFFIIQNYFNTLSNKPKFSHHRGTLKKFRTELYMPLFQLCSYLVIQILLLLLLLLFYGTSFIYRFYKS